MIYKESSDGERSVSILLSVLFVGANAGGCSTTETIWVSDSATAGHVSSVASGYGVPKCFAFEPLHRHHPRMVSGDYSCDRGGQVHLQGAEALEYLLGERGPRFRPNRFTSVHDHVEIKFGGSFLCGSGRRRPILLDWITA
ncbi:hypothetical protein VTH82DRAFT_1660 [Thermothelomyces myriococcoides]